MTLGNEQIVRQACKIAEDKDLEGWVMPRLSSPVPRKDCRLHDHQPARADRDVPN
jgi:hypothetical protein